MSVGTMPVDLAGNREVDNSDSKEPFFPAETTDDNARISAAINQPHVVVRIKNMRVGISAKHTKFLMMLPKVTALPGGKPGFRGMINIRGSVIPVFDLRSLMGMATYSSENEEIIKILHEREQDHKNWVNTLLAAVESGKEFTLARDPTKCKFGKWYGSYRPENQSVAFLSIWRSFNEPHRHIHSIADQVLELARQGDPEKARAIIHATRDKELMQMIGIFENTRNILRESTREVVIVLSHNNIEYAVAVDEVLSIDKFDVIEPMTDKTIYSFSKLTPWVARRKGSDQIVLLLDCQQMS